MTKTKILKAFSAIVICNCFEFPFTLSLHPTAFDISYTNAIKALYNLYSKFYSYYLAAFKTAYCIVFKIYT